MPKVSEKDSNIVDFIGLQEQSLIGGLINLKSELVFMVKLDELYQQLMRWHSIQKSDEMLVMGLFLDAHKSYYYAMLNFLRNGFSVSLMSARRAIEAGLTAYHLLIHPEDQPVFYDRNHSRYKEVFKRITGYMKDHLAEYPVAGGLIETYALTNKWALHATAEALSRQLEIQKPTEEELGRLLSHYSEVLDYPDPYLGHYYFLIYIFAMVHKIFWEGFFQPRFKIINPSYEKDLAEFKKLLNEKTGKHPLSAQ